GHGGRVRGQRAFMCRAVDAFRKAARDAEPRGGKVFRELESGAYAAARRITTADDRKRRQPEYIGIAAYEEPLRRIGNFLQQPGVVRRTSFHDVVAACRGPGCVCVAHGFNGEQSPNETGRYSSSTGPHANIEDP